MKSTHLCILISLALIFSGSLATKATTRTEQSYGEEQLSIVMNELLSTLYEVQEKLLSEYGAFQTYCDTMEDTIESDIDTYNELISDSDLLITSYTPLLEEDEEELDNVETEISEKNDELTEGEETRTTESTESEQTIATIDDDLLTLDDLLSTLNSLTAISMAEVFDSVYKIRSETTMIEQVTSSLVSLTDSEGESEDISTETRDLLVSMLSELGTEILSIKELEIESENAASDRWDELETMLNDRLSQLEIRSAELSFQIKIYGILVEDNETQVSMYQNRIEMLESLLSTVSSGCTEEINSYELQTDTIAGKIESLETALTY